MLQGPRLYEWIYLPIGATSADDFLEVSWDRSVIVDNPNGLLMTLQDASSS